MAAIKKGRIRKWVHFAHLHLVSIHRDRGLFYFTASNPSYANSHIATCLMNIH